MTDKMFSRSGGKPRLREEVIREIFDTTSDAIFVHENETGEIIDTNQTACEMYGYDKEALLELTVEELSSGDPPYTQATAIEKIRAAAAGNAQKFDWRAKHRDGSLFWVEVSMRQTVIEGEQLIIVIVRDITERKEREQQLKDQNARLEEFANVVSHDLRSPLNMADMRLELAQEECESDHLAAIERGHERMRRIIDDVLWLAREGEGVGELQAVNLVKTVREVWSMVADQVTTAQLEVETPEQQTRREIRADPSRFRQLLENLFRNAIEHAGPEVTVTVGELTDGFYVEDDGTGIPRDEHRAVFEAGYSTNEDGAGYGLKIAKQVAEAHGWTIQVAESNSGGARFVISGLWTAGE